MRPTLARGRRRGLLRRLPGAGNHFMEMNIRNAMRLVFKEIRDIIVSYIISRLHSVPEPAPGCNRSERPPRRARASARGAAVGAAVGAPDLPADALSHDHRGRRTRMPDGARTRHTLRENPHDRGARSARADVPCWRGRRRGPGRNAAPAPGRATLVGSSRRRSTLHRAAACARRHGTAGIYRARRPGRVPRASPSTAHHGLVGRPSPDRARAAWRRLCRKSHRG